MKACARRSTATLLICIMALVSVFGIVGFSAGTATAEGEAGTIKEAGILDQDSIGHIYVGIKFHTPGQVAIAEDQSPLTEYAGKILINGFELTNNSGYVSMYWDNSDHARYCVNGLEANTVTLSIVIGCNLAGDRTGAYSQLMRRDGTDRITIKQGTVIGADSTSTTNATVAYDVDVIIPARSGSDLGMVAVSFEPTPVKSSVYVPLKSVGLIDQINTGYMYVMAAFETAAPQGINQNIQGLLNGYVMYNDQVATSPIHYNLRRGDVTGAWIGGTVEGDDAVLNMLVIDANATQLKRNGNDKILIKKGTPVGLYGDRVLLTDKNYEITYVYGHEVGSNTASFKAVDMYASASRMVGNPATINEVIIDTGIPTDDTAITNLTTAEEALVEINGVTFAEAKAGYDSGKNWISWRRDAFTGNRTLVISMDQNNPYGTCVYTSDAITLKAGLLIPGAIEALAEDVTVYDDEMRDNKQSTGNVAINGNKVAFEFNAPLQRPSAWTIDAASAPSFSWYTIVNGQYLANVLTGINYVWDDPAWGFGNTSMALEFVDGQTIMKMDGTPNFVTLRRALQINGGADVSYPNQYNCVEETYVVIMNAADPSMNSVAKVDPSKASVALSTPAEIKAGDAIPTTVDYYYDGVKVYSNVTIKAWDEVTATVSGDMTVKGYPVSIAPYIPLEFRQANLNVSVGASISLKLDANNFVGNYNGKEGVIIFCQIEDYDLVKDEITEVGIYVEGVIGLEYYAAKRVSSDGKFGIFFHQINEDGMPIGGWVPKAYAVVNGEYHYSASGVAFVAPAQ